MRLFGIDFTSRPTRRKPITVAEGHVDGDGLCLERVSLLESFAEFDALLQRAGPWLAACDFPFGLPRELVETLGWPLEWPALMTYLHTLDRGTLTNMLRSFCAQRPVGGKFAHRAVDSLARSSPSMKWVNPPVAYMLHEGATRLQAAGLSLPGLQDGDPLRVAIEAYPALAARAVIGNASYKSDDKARQTPERRERRARIVGALRAGEHPLGIRLKMDDHLADRLIDDASADTLDAVLCLLQAAWATRQIGYGLPTDMDPLEGWIVTVVATPPISNTN
ncbi:DUF429 domain-containing protein [Chitinimonas naiadis]